MAVNENLFGQDQLGGHTDLLTRTAPALRGSIKRHDPDTGHSYPFVGGLDGTTLELEISQEPISATPVTFSITFSFGVGRTDSYTDAIDQINGASTDVQAEDDGGFIKLVSQHVGYNNYLKITGGDSLDLLGLIEEPYPGSVCYAGELEPTPPGVQGNPEGTMLIGRDEDLTSSVINRAILGSQRALLRQLRNLDREMLGVVEVPVTVPAHGGESKSWFIINNPTLRLPLTAFSNLLDLVTLLNSDGRELYQLDPVGDKSGSKVHIDGVYYGGPPFSGTPFATWGTPNGGTVLNAAVPAKTKHAAVDITTIDGDLVYCEDADFSTAYVQVGDTALIADSPTKSPFCHDGEFVIARVIDSKHVVLRPKTALEALVFAGEEKPTCLNATGSSFGTLLVPIGYFIPCHQMTFQVDAVITPGAHFARLNVGKRLQDVAPEDLRRNLSNNADHLGIQVHRHFDEVEGDGGPEYLHNAVAVQTRETHAWYGGTETIPVGRVQGVIDTIIDNLAERSPISGSKRIGALGVTGTPHSLVDSSIWDQFGSVLGWLNDHVYQGTADRHRAEDIDKRSAGNNWHDGTTNPGGVTVQAALDKIIDDLIVSAQTNPAHDGASKIGAQESLGSPTPKSFSHGSVRDQLDALLGWLNTTAFLDLDNEFTGTNTFDHAILQNDPGLDGDGLRMVMRFNIGGNRYARIYTSQVVGQLYPNELINFHSLRVVIGAAYEDRGTGWKWYYDTPNAHNASCLILGTTHTPSEAGGSRFMVFGGSTGWAEDAWVTIYNADATYPSTFKLGSTLDLLTALTYGSLPTTPRIRSDRHATAPYTLLWEQGYLGTQYSDGSMKVRFYRYRIAGSPPLTDALAITINAYCDDAGTTWYRDSGAYVLDSVRYQFTNGYMRIQKATGASWAEGAWVTKTTMDNDGKITCVEVDTGPIATNGYTINTGGGAVRTGGGKVQTTGGDIEITTGRLITTNEPALQTECLPGYYSRSNACKFWAQIAIHSGHVSPTIDGGYNYYTTTPIEYPVAGNYAVCQVNYQNPMPHSVYAVVPAYHPGDGWYYPQIFYKDQNCVRFSLVSATDPPGAILLYEHTGWVYLIAF